MSPPVGVERFRRSPRPQRHGLIQSPILRSRLSFGAGLPLAEAFSTAIWLGSLKPWSFQKSTTSANAMMIFVNRLTQNVVSGGSVNVGSSVCSAVPPVEIGAAAAVEAVVDGRCGPRRRAPRSRSLKLDSVTKDSSTLMVLTFI